MKVVIQRVSQSSVTIDGKEKSAIKVGLLVLAGIGDSDSDEDIKWLSNKIVNLRIFDDQNKIPNLSVKEIGGDILLVSQFTLQASTKKGNRPSYLKASKAVIAIPLYEKMINQLNRIIICADKLDGIYVFGGEFTKLCDELFVEIEKSITLN